MNCQQNKDVKIVLKYQHKTYQLQKYVIEYKHQKDKKDLNYKKGQPYKLCKTLLDIDKDFNKKADKIIKDYKSFPDKIKNDKRIGLNSNNPYRYYLDLDELK